MGRPIIVGPLFLIVNDLCSDRSLNPNRPGRLRIGGPMRPAIRAKIMVLRAAAPGRVLRSAPRRRKLGPRVASGPRRRGYSKTTANTYSNDTTNWFLGRLTRAEVTSVTP